MIEQYVSPAEFRRLMSALIVVLGFIAIAAFFAFLIVPGLRYQAHTSNESSVVAVQGDSGWLEATDYLPSAKVELPPIDPQTVLVATPDLLTRGKTLYTQTCATCHGPAGQGDGPGGKGLNPPPRNFTTPSGWKNGTRIEDIFRTLEQGVKGSAMVSYNYLTKRDRMALVHYVQSLGSFDHGQSIPEARAALEKQFSGAGEVIPNRIPVHMAIAKLVEEYHPPAPLESCQAASELEPIGDPRRASATLTALPSDGKDPVAVHRGLAMGAPYNGFAVEVDTYSAAQWNQLRLCLHPH